MGRLIYLKDVVTLQFNEEACVGCGMCVAVCPHEVFVMNNGKVHIRERDACMECGACAVNCPADALSVQAGVGCAAAVINSALGRRDNSCCCIAEPRDLGKRGGSSCC
ncbi:MAG: ferridoxin [Deltaproteobacteria bacterium]|nr:MAG: ferridoxin [Deltaproteobacteria bacterium]